MPTKEQCQAASQAVGQEVSALRVDAALYQYHEYSLEKLKKELESLKRIISANKNHVLNLVDVVNNIQIAIAAREVVNADDATE